MKLLGVKAFRAVDRDSRKPVAVGIDHRGRDMLRYDQAFVNPAWPAIVVFPRWAGRGLVPTFDRWASNLLDLEPTTEYTVEAVRASADSWITYRHPRTEPHGPLDYTRLLPVTLAAYLAARPIDDLAPIAAPEASR